jgi:hypothetical protein
MTCTYRSPRAAQLFLLLRSSLLGQLVQSSAVRTGNHRGIGNIAPIPRSLRSPWHPGTQTQCRMSKGNSAPESPARGLARELAYGPISPSGALQSSLTDLTPSTKSVSKSATVPSPSFTLKLSLLALPQQPARSHRTPPARSLGRPTTAFPATTTSPPTPTP